MNIKYKNFINKKKENLYRYYNTISLNKIKAPLTILLGPNGCGKSSTLRDLKSTLKKKKITYIEYTTSHDDIVQKSAPAFGNWDVAGIACAFHSEGERMSDSFYRWMNNDFLKAVLETTETLYVLIDESDSGLSIDKIYETYTPLLFVLHEELKKKRNIKVIITCNSFELAEILNISIANFIWVPTGDSIKISTYEKFKKPYVEYWEEMKKLYE